VKPNTTDDVLELMESYIASAALGAAMELGLFWLLAEQPRDAAGVAKALAIPERRCGYWLELLSSTGLLIRDGNAYAPSPTARTAILEAYSQEAWALLAQEARERFPTFCDLALCIRELRAAGAPQELTLEDYVARMEEEPERARRFTRMLYELHQPLADELANTLDMTGVERLMDLGGGSGVVSLALLRRHPQLTATVVDMGNVCKAGREIAMENSMEERLTYHAADFLQDELPSGFDMVLECDVGVYGEGLFRKLREALNPRGRVVIVDRFAPAEGVAPPARLNWAFRDSLDDPDFTMPWVARTQDLLAQTGFQLLSKYTLSSGWTVIEARRQHRENLLN
jgi:predicted O-methyltransferase YrrM